MKRAAGPQALYKSERKELRNINRVELVKRTLLLRIAAAWIITVPATAILSAMIYFMLRGLMMP
jgi:PiT family inorganic phosphate transporter